MVLYCLMLHGSAYRSAMPYFQGVAFVVVGALIVYLLSDIFIERLRQPIMQVLPWPVRETVQSYRNTTLWVLVPLLVPQVLMCLSLHLEWWKLLTLLIGETLLFIAYLERTLVHCAKKPLRQRGNSFVPIINWVLFAALTALMIWQPLFAPLIGGAVWFAVRTA